MASHKEQKSVHASAKHGSGSIFSTELRGGWGGGGVTYSVYVGRDTLEQVLVDAVVCEPCLVEL